jgi:hypothetical protein
MGTEIFIYLLIGSGNAAANSSMRFFFLASLEGQVKCQRHVKTKDNASG